MHRFLFVFLIFISLRAFAQGGGDLRIVPGADGWSISHRVAKAETIFSLSRRYHVPPDMLAAANKLTYNDGLREGSSVLIPIGPYNLQTSSPTAGSSAVKLWYEVRPQDNLYSIARTAGVSQRAIESWNGLKAHSVAAGQMVQVGWLLDDPNLPAPLPVHTMPVPVAKPTVTTTTAMPRTDTPRYVMTADTIVRRTDTVAAKPRLALESEYLSQTGNLQNVVHEKGSSAFFNLTTSTKGAAIFAFHNAAAKGSVLKVKNISNGRYVYVKVIGPLPATKQYYGCILGLSDKAKVALGVQEQKMFCEVSYAGY